MCNWLRHTHTLAPHRTEEYELAIRKNPPRVKITQSETDQQGASNNQLLCFLVYIILSVHLLHRSPGLSRRHGTTAERSSE